MELKTGIYCIINRKNCKRYIGKSLDIYKRFQNHKSHLKNNNHPNLDIQNDWNMYGKESFDFIILEECDANMLQKREQYFLKYYNSINDGYNKSDAIDQYKVERVSFYLKPSTMKKLKKAAKQSDMKISPFLQKLLENVLDKIVIEE